MSVRKGQQVARVRRASIGVALVALVLTGGLARSQTPATPDIVAGVRAAMATGGLIAGDKALAEYRAVHGSTSEAIDALLWLARGALSAQQFDKANQYAKESHDLALRSVKAGAGDERLWHSLGQAVEVLALVLVEQGGRSDAIYFLLGESATYLGTPIHDRIQANIKLLSLEGKPAPPLESGQSLGPRLSTAADSKPPALLVFFWAHWCQECKAESPMIAGLVDKYRAKGLALVAPTRRYGYINAGRNASPEREFRHIVQVRDAFYPFLKSAWVPVTDANHKAYGVAAIPMHILVDRSGVVRLYRPGRMTEAELEAAILSVLEP
jgi:thiol-disulfide isomerase/thioredoxin